MSGDIAVFTTAMRRPYYFEETLSSWSKARGIETVGGFHVAMGLSDRFTEMEGVLKRSRISGLDGFTLAPDPHPGMGMHWAIGAMFDSLFGPHGHKTESEFVIATEEDVVVSDDVIEYFQWAKETFADDQRVLLVNAHSIGGQGWDLHLPVQDGDANQQAVRLLPYFNAWCWGTWRDRWPALREQWDWDCTSGHATGGYSGWDWNIASRIIPQGNWLCVTPDASRSQNIGRMEGWASSPWSWGFSQAQSFRPHREPGYQLEGA